MGNRITAEMIRVAADIIVFVAALGFLFYLMSEIAEMIDLCMPVSQFTGRV